MGTSKHCTEVTWAQKDKHIMFSLTSRISRLEQILVRTTNRKGAMGKEKKSGGIRKEVEKTVG